MSDPAADGAGRSAASPPLDCVFLLAVVPQVICSCMIAGISAHRLMPLHVAMGLHHPPLTAIMRLVVKPVSLGAIAMVLLLGAGAVAARCRRGPAAATLIGGLGLSCVLLLVLWQFAAGLPLQIGIRAMNGGDFWERSGGWAWSIPFALSGVALVATLRSARAAKFPWLELGHLVAFLGIAGFGLTHGQVHRCAAEDLWGPLPWDLWFLEFPWSGCLLSLVGNAILVVLHVRRPDAHSRWRLYFILLVSTCTILIASRRLAYWVQALG